MADAHGSGPCDSNIMRVQVSFPASETPAFDVGVFLFDDEERNISQFVYRCIRCQNVQVIITIQKVLQNTKIPIDICGETR